MCRATVGRGSSAMTVRGAGSGDFRDVGAHSQQRGCGRHEGVAQPAPMASLHYGYAQKVQDPISNQILQRDRARTAKSGGPCCLCARTTGTLLPSFLLLRAGWLLLAIMLRQAVWVLMIRSMLTCPGASEGNRLCRCTLQHDSRQGCCSVLYQCA